MCDVCVKVWPYLRVLIENNNYMYSWSGFLPLTIVGEECHAIVYGRKLLYIMLCMTVTC